jgi:molybdopterin-guanine dinucleotide biosynthesis protein A
MLKRISAVVSIITLIFSTLMLQQGQSKKLYLNQEIKINYIRMIDEKIFVFDFKNLNEDEDLNTIINQKDSP